MHDRKILTAGEGMVLTDGRSFGDVIYLGEYDTAENWHKITKSEAEQMLGIEIKEECL